MTRDRLEAALRRIFAQVFDVPEARVDRGFTQDSTPAWDSLHHLGLVTSIEDELDVTLDDRDLVELTSFELALVIVGEKLGVGAPA